MITDWSSPVPLYNNTFLASRAVPNNHPLVFFCSVIPPICTNIKDNLQHPQNPTKDRAGGVNILTSLEVTETDKKKGQNILF